jgi:hypothetical protein
MSSGNEIRGRKAIQAALEKTIACSWKLSYELGSSSGFSGIFEIVAADEAGVVG